MNGSHAPGRHADEINADGLRTRFEHSKDVRVRDIPLSASAEAVLLYCEGLCDTEQIDRLLLPRLRERPPIPGDPGSAPEFPLLVRQERLEKTMPWSSLEERLFDGELILFVRGESESLLYAFRLDNSPGRTTEESNVEISVVGPSDGFVEDVQTNIALVRKRLKTTSLRIERFTIGSQSRTSVQLLYMADRLAPELLRQVRGKLRSIVADSVRSASQLENLIGRQPFSIFPQFHYTGRPDFAVECMLRGRFLLLADGIPVAIIGPANLFLLLKSPEDQHFPFLMVSFGRLLRYAGLVISIFLPGFWTALAVYNQDQLPFPLLATVTMARLGTPLSASAEMLLMLIMMELFREAGVRLPKTISQTVTVVGGIIIGEASIQAGIFSPTIVIVAAIAAVCASTVVNQMLSGLTVVLRLGIFLLSALFGMYGFMIGLFAIVLYLASLRSFGHPYLLPFSPPRWREIGLGLLKLPGKWTYRRPERDVPDAESGVGKEEQP